jgi:CubicO group peptidase (beta-lactamase class C family)
MGIIANLTTLIFILLLSGSCKKNESEIIPQPSEKMYFPSNNTWATVSISSLGWNQNAIQPLKDYLNQKGAKSFMMLVNGRIVMEEYFNGHSATDTWEWNSAGKTLVASTVGIAQQESLLNINNKVSDYLGLNWTNMPLPKESLITVKNLLNMTAGNDETKQYMIKSNLNYVADAGTRWAYSNIFQKLTDVVSSATNKPFETYFNDKLKSKIGMEGYWNFGPIFTIYHSNTKSMARFGLLALNKGKWSNEQILNETYFTESISTSQNINPSYGYLWWLNGKTSFIIPGEQKVNQGFLVPNAPPDMFAAMGAKDQRIYVIPSKKMVIIRMGEASDPSNPNFALSSFDNELWAKIKLLIN